MARSVSTHCHAVVTVYLHNECEEDWQWDDFLDNLRAVLQDRYPSLSDCDRWAGREDHVVLENRRAEVSVSEYCGLVAVCLAPRDPDDGLDQGWAGQVADDFREHLEKSYSCALRSIGRASNGEHFFTSATTK